MTLLVRDAWLPTPEDVIIQKLRWSKGAKRSKDFADVVAVIADGVTRDPPGFQLDVFPGNLAPPFRQEPP
jgi:hypothetical protein